MITSWSGKGERILAHSSSQTALSQHEAPETKSPPMTTSKLLQGSSEPIEAQRGGGPSLGGKGIRERFKEEEVYEL